MSLKHPDSLQLFLSSNNCTSINDAVRRNQIRQVLNEPILVPQGYEAKVTLVSAEVPNTWVALQKFLLMRSNLKARNQLQSGRYFAKIPVTAGQGFVIQYFNFTNYGHPIVDKEIAYIEVSIHNEDGTDVSLGAGIDWSCTLQVDFIKI